MQGLQPVCKDVVGLKRHLSSASDDFDFRGIQKKVKTEVLVKIEESDFAKASTLPKIPALSIPQSNNSPTYFEQLNSIALLNQSAMLQKYLQFMTVTNYLAGVAQQRNLLSLKRDDSASTCSSFTSAQSFSSPVKVPKLLQTSKLSPILETPPKLETHSSKKGFKVSACKNYIALLCTGFARSILTADPTSEIIGHLNQIIQDKKANFLSLKERSMQSLKEYVLEHIHKDICGKKVKKTNKGRDFKVRNTEELEFLLIAKEGDSEILCFRKEILKEMIDYFFTSNCYLEWLEKGMINEANRNFFLKNKSEIQKKFINPALYKPHFDYSS